MRHFVTIFYRTSTYLRLPYKMMLYVRRSVHWRSIYRRCGILLHCQQIQSILMGKSLCGVALTRLRAKDIIAYLWQFVNTLCGSDDVAGRRKMSNMVAFVLFINGKSWFLTPCVKILRFFQKISNTVFRNVHHTRTVRYTARLGVECKADHYKKTHRTGIRKP